MKLLHLFILLVVGLLPGGLFAQGEPVRSFRVLGYGEGDFQDIVFERMVEGKATVAGLEFVPNRKSRRIALAEEQASLSFFTETFAGDGKAERRELGEVEWPGNAEKLLLVFLQSGGGGEAASYEILAFDESEAVWGPRCVRFLNLSGAALNASMSQFEFPLASGPSEILCFDGQYSIPMTLELSVPIGGKSEIVYSARFVADQFSPKFVVIKPPATEGSLKVVVDTLW